MAQAECPVEIVALGQREDASGCDDPVASDNRTAVMQHSLWVKDRQEQLLRERRIELDPALGHGIQGNVPLERNQRPEALAGKIEDRIGDFLDLLAALEGRCEKPVASQLVEGAAKFGLKDHHQCDRQKDREALEEPTEHRKVEKLRDEGE